jgi:hypothetical protein
MLEKELDVYLSFLSWDFFCLENEYFFFSMQEIELSLNPLTNYGNGVAPHYLLIAHLGKVISNGNQVNKQVFYMSNLYLF